MPWLLLAMVPLACAAGNVLPPTLLGPALPPGAVRSGPHPAARTDRAVAGAPALAPARVAPDPPAGRTGALRPASDSVKAVCSRIARELASVGFRECMERGLVMSAGRSVLGVPLLIRRYPPLPDHPPQARVLLFGGIHGDEFSSVSIIFKWMRLLEQRRDGRFHWHVVPLVNPDGLLQRKSTRTNAHGVDLNRNFPTPDWEAQSRDYWVRRTGRNPRRYPGDAAMSEPETRWLASEIRRFRPDAIVAVHAPYSVVDFDGPEEGPERLGRLQRNLMGTYPGSLGNYAGVQRRIPVITIELPRAGTLPTVRETGRIWSDLVRWLGENIPRPHTLAARSGRL